MSRFAKKEYNDPSLIAAARKAVEKFGFEEAKDLEFGDRIRACRVLIQEYRKSKLPKELDDFPVYLAKALDGPELTEAEFLDF